MPDEDTARLALRTADQRRTDIANLECGQEFLMQRINQVPTARDLWRAATLIALVAALLGIVGIEARATFPACGWNWPDFGSAFGGRAMAHKDFIWRDF